MRLARVLGFRIYLRKIFCSGFFDKFFELWHVLVAAVAFAFALAVNFQNFITTFKFVSFVMNDGI